MHPSVASTLVRFDHSGWEFEGALCGWGIQIYDHMASNVRVGGGCILGLIVCFLGGERTATVSYKLYDRGPKGLN